MPVYLSNITDLNNIQFLNFVMCLGVDHGEELGYLFYSYIFNNTDLSQTTTQDYKIMQKMIKLWTAFAISG